MSSSPAFESQPGELIEFDNVRRKLEIKTHTNSVRTGFRFEDAELTYVNDSFISIGLTDVEAAFAHTLMNSVDTPITYKELEKRLKDKFPGEEIDLRLIFDHLVQSDGLEYHLINTAKGSSSWYGFISDSNDVSLLCERGRAIIDATSRSERQAEKRKRVFDALEHRYNDEITETSESRRKLIQAGYAAAAIVGVSVGLTSAYVAVKKQSSK